MPHLSIGQIDQLGHFSRQIRQCHQLDQWGIYVLAGQRCIIPTYIFMEITAVPALTVPNTE